jgi:superfamily II DNA or RNA helicase/GNAT superfamily N-acetyltransferase
MAVSRAELMADAVAKYASEPQVGTVAASLDSHQLSVVRAVGESWRGGPAGHIKEPTGGGKTRMAAAIIEATHGVDPHARTLVVVPRINLIQQAVDEFGRSPAVLEGGITPYYGGAKDLSGRVNITTYSSLLLGLARGDIKPHEYALLVLDEAHHALPDRRATATRSFDDALQLGLTATPGYGKNKHVREILPQEISNTSIRKAVEANRLASFSVFLVETGVSLADVRVKGQGSQKEFDEHALAGAVNVAVRNQAAVDLYEQSLMGRQTVAYCAGIDHAKALAEQFNARGIKAAAIYGSEPEKWKALLLDQYRQGKIQVLCNADLLIEGFDDVKTSVILNLRPTLSPRLAEQRGGRALRLDRVDRSKQALIIDFIDEVDGANNPISFAQVAEAAQITNTWYQSSGAGEIENFGLAIPKLKGMKVVTGKAEVMWAVNELSGMDFEIEEGWKTLRRISAESGIPLDVLRLWEANFLGKNPDREDEVKDFVSPHGQSIRHYDLGVTLYFLSLALFFKGYSPNTEALEGDDLYIKNPGNPENSPDFELDGFGMRMLRRLKNIDAASLIKYADGLYNQLVERGDKEFARYLGLSSKQEAHEETLRETNDPQAETVPGQDADLSVTEDKPDYDRRVFHPDTVDFFKACVKLGDGTLIALKKTASDGKRLFMQVRYLDVPQKGSNDKVNMRNWFAHDEGERPTHLVLIDVYTDIGGGKLNPIAHLDLNDYIPMHDPNWTRIMMVSIPAATANANVHDYAIPQSNFEADAKRKWTSRGGVSDFSSWVDSEYVRQGIGSLMLAASGNLLRAKGFSSFLTGALTTRETKVYKGMGLSEEELFGHKSIDVDRIVKNPIADAAIERYLQEGKAHI